MWKLLLTIFLNFLIISSLLIFVFLGYQLYNAYRNDGAEISDFIEPRYLLSLVHIDIEEKTELFDSQTFTFEHPTSWEPRRQDVFGTGAETIDLKIPIFYQVSKFGGSGVIGYAKESIDKLRPPQESIISEQDFIIANRKGYKWIYTQNHQYHFRYAIPLFVYNISNKQISSFLIEAESNNQNKNLEKVLDNLAKSVKFKNEEFN